jgi:2-oxoisovalerate dehydrogenase E1 component
MPSSPADAKGLMKTALRGSNPVVMLETKALFASKGTVPVGEHFVPFGVAEVVREGTDISVVSAGQLVHRALEAADTLSREGIACEVVDLRTLMPLDVATVADSIRKTHRLLVVDEGYAMCGIGAEIAQAMNELVYDQLDGPIGRLHTDALTHPFAPALERAMLVDAPRIAAAIRDVIEGNAPVPDHWRNAGVDLSRPTRPPLRVAGTARPLVTSQAAQHPEPPLPVDGKPITMPFGDLTVSEGKIVRWVRPEGARFSQGELIAEIETDKAVVEIEAPCTGVLAVIEQPAGAVVKMGERIGVMRQA